MLIINPFVFSQGSTVPTASLDFERDSSQYLTMSAANFGEYDRQKFAISMWLKRESVGTFQGIFSFDASGFDASLLETRCYFASNNTLEFFTKSAAGTDGRLRTSDAYTSTTNWYHVLLHFDGANATAGDRMRMWIDGTEITSFFVDQNPTNDIPNQATTMGIGRFNGAGNYFDGLLYQFAFFSGSLPAISDVYDAGKAKNVSGLPGLYSVLDGVSAVSDGVLSTDWTNNGSVTTSTTIP